jgi:hypothetical protein
MRRIPTKSGSRQGEPVDQTMWTLPCDGVRFFFVIGGGVWLEPWVWCPVARLRFISESGGARYTHRAVVCYANRLIGHRARRSVGCSFVSAVRWAVAVSYVPDAFSVTCIGRPAFIWPHNIFFPTRNVRSGSSCCLPPPAGGSIRFRALALLACKRVPDEKSSDGSC